MIKYIIGKIANYKNCKQKNKAAKSDICRVVNDLEIKELLRVYRKICRYKTAKYKKERDVLSYAQWKKLVCEKISTGAVPDYYDYLIRLFRLRARNIENTDHMPFALIAFIAGLVASLIIELCIPDLASLISVLDSGWFWLGVIIAILVIFPGYILFSIHLHREYEMYEDIIEILEEMKEEATAREKLKLEADNCN